MSRLDKQVAFLEDKAEEQGVSEELMGRPLSKKPMPQIPLSGPR